MSKLIGIDPGRSKCGIVLVDEISSEVIQGLVIPTYEVLPQINNWFLSNKITLTTIGNGTGSQYLVQQLNNVGPILIVDEKGTSLKARKRYWQIWPAKGLKRIMPISLRFPPEELDAVAALLILENHTGKKYRWSVKKPKFKNENGQ